TGPVQHRSGGALGLRNLPGTSRTRRGGPGIANCFSTGRGQIRGCHTLAGPRRSHPEADGRGFPQTLGTKAPHAGSLASGTTRHASGQVVPAPWSERWNFEARAGRAALFLGGLCPERRLAVVSRERSSTAS